MFCNNYRVAAESFKTWGPWRRNNKRDSWWWKSWGRFIWSRTLLMGKLVPDNVSTVRIRERSFPSPPGPSSLRGTRLVQFDSRGHTFPFLLCTQRSGLLWEQIVERHCLSNSVPWMIPTPGIRMLFLQGVCESPVQCRIVCLRGDIPLDLCFRVCLLSLPVQT